MKELRAALLLPLAAALLVRAEIASLLPLLGMVLLGFRASGRFSISPQRWILPLLSLPFVLQAALIPAGNSVFNLLRLYAIGAHYLYWIGIQQAITRGRENGALPFALGSIAAASLHLPSGQLWLPLLALPLLPLALLPADGGNNFFLPTRRGRVSWFLLWALAIAAVIGGHHAFEKSRYRWMGWQSSGSEQLLGFSEKSDLNRPPGEWTSRRKDQVILRVYGEECSQRLSGKNYGFYRNGVWSVSGRSEWKEPTGVRVSHQIFGRGHSGEEWIWVESLLPLEGVLFVPTSLSAIALLADTLTLSAEGSPRLLTSETPSPWLVQREVTTSEGTPEELLLSTPPLPQDLALPTDLIPWLDSLALEVWGDSTARKNLSVPEKIGGLQQWLFSSFRYAWVNPTPIEKEPLRGFVAEQRGYCDHFASLATLLLRTEGISARYSKGYLPGVKIGNSCSVRRIEAHSWTLVWLDGRWQTVEATPSEGIDRIKMSWRRIQQERVETLIARIKQGIFHGKWRLWLEEGANRWQKGFLYAGLLSLLAFSLWIAWRRLRERALSPEERLWPRAARLLRAEGVEIERGENAADLLQRVEALPASRRIASAQKLLHQYQKRRWKL